jgi:hypothetical protein
MRILRPGRSRRLSVHRHGNDRARRQAGIVGTGPGALRNAGSCEFPGGTPICRHQNSRRRSRSLRVLGVKRREDAWKRMGGVVFRK